MLGAQCQAGADRKDVGAEPQQRSRVVGHERANLFNLRFPLEDIDLVDDDDDLLAPAAHLLEKRPFGFGEGPIGGGHKQHEIRARHELGRNQFVLTDDRVRPRRIDDVNFAEDLGRRSDDVQVRVTHLPIETVRRTAARLSAPWSA